MNIILKSSLRTLLQNKTLNRCSSKRLCASKNIDTEQKSSHAELSLEKLPSMTSTAAVLNMVQKEMPKSDPKYLVKALSTIFELEKSRPKQDITNVIKDPVFNMLCLNIQKQARALDINDVIESIKALSFLNVPVQSTIVQTLLQLVRSNINYLNTRQVMFLDFILHKYNTNNHLCDALKIALPLAFQVQLPLEIDVQDFSLLRDMLIYSCHHNLPDRCVNNVVTALLLHDGTIDVRAAKSLVWALCTVNCTTDKYPTRAQLLSKCLDTLSQDLYQLRYEDVLRTAARLKGRILQKNSEYYHEHLMDAFGDYVIRHNLDFDKAMLIARILSRVAHTNTLLAEYLCQKAVENPETLVNAKLNIYFGFVNYLSNNNYKPDPATWQEIRRQILLNPVLEGHNIELPWTKFCLELASLDTYEDSLLRLVFSEKFFTVYFSRDENRLDYLQLLMLYNAVQTFHSNEYVLSDETLQKAKELYPTHSVSAQLKEYLSKGLGGDGLVARDVVLPSGIIADAVLCVKNGQVLKLRISDEQTKIPLESLEIPDNSITICVMNFNSSCFSINSSRLRGVFQLVLDVLERQGYAVVGLNVNDWLNAPEAERIPYLMREVGHTCGELGLNLAAT